MKCSKSIVFAGSLVLASLCLNAQNVQTGTIQPTPASSGAQMYREYCAVCHGALGKGDGPAAPAMKKRPSNLTELKARNKGNFPANHIFGVIKGDAESMSAHGSKDMPVWGTVFSSLAHGNQAEIQLRITNLVDYIKGLQVP